MRALAWLFYLMARVVGVLRGRARHTASSTTGVENVDSSDSREEENTGRRNIYPLW